MAGDFKGGRANGSSSSFGVSEGLRGGVGTAGRNDSAGGSYRVLSLLSKSSLYCSLY